MKKEYCTHKMEPGDTVTVRVTGGSQIVEVLEVKHLENEGAYVMNDVVTIKFSNGAVAKFYRKDIKEGDKRAIK